MSWVDDALNAAASPFERGGVIGNVATGAVNDLRHVFLPARSDNHSLAAILSGLGRGLHDITGLGGGGGAPAPAKKPGKGKPAAAPAQPAAEQFDLSKLAQSEMSPLVDQLSKALGLPQGAAPSQDQLAGAASPGLAEYLGNLQSGLGHMNAGPQAGGGGGLAAVLTQGLGNVGAADAGMAPAIQQYAAGLGKANLLSDLLKAAAYQAIYKQSGYGQPPSQGQPGYDPILSQLYGTVVAGGNALSGGLPGSITQPPGKAGSSVVNAGSSPFNS